MNKHLRIFIIFILALALFSCGKNQKNTFTGTDNSYDFRQFVNLKELQGQLHTIADNNTSSVVSISTEKIISQPAFDPFDFFFKSPWGFDDEDQRKQPAPQKKKEYKQGGLGSGVVYQKKDNVYYIITNNHVIEGVDKIKVIVNQDKNYDAKVLGADPEIDIAVVEIKTKDNLSVAKYGNSDILKVGDFVIAIGNPFGLQGTMTFGIISALGRGDITGGGKGSLTSFIQTDAAINPGNSGGPLLNLESEVIGINTLIYSQSGGNVGIGFAIPINVAKKAIDQIITKGKVEHGWLGVYFEPLTEETIKTLNLKNIDKGVYVTQVIEGSPADKAGIKTGDVLIELNGKKLVKSNDLMQAIGNSSPGTKVTFKFSRDGKISEKEVTLGDRTELKSAAVKDAELLENYGMSLSDLDNELKKQYKIPSDFNGAVVSKVVQRGLANQAGIQEGDLIYKINNRLIKSVKEVKDSLQNDNPSNYFFIYRKGKEIIIKM